MQDTDRAGSRSAELPATGGVSSPGTVTPPSISLPTGGGAIRGMGEKFTANPATGTASLSVPIATSPGRAGIAPRITLSYDSGAGNGPFGLGWRLSLPSVTRKTDKGLPRYRDAEESDVFILSGAEDLVPVFRQDEDGEWMRDGEGKFVVHEETRDGFLVRRYRPRIEGLFASIERWTKIDDPLDIHWRSISKDNLLTIYGKDDHSRISDPDVPGRIFSWLIAETRDDRGNAIIYRYTAENDDGVDLSRANERNRRRKANRYLKRILYGNRQSLLDEGTRPRFVTADALDDAGWMFEVVFDYGEGHYSELPPDDALPATAQHRFVQATPVPQEAWVVREDPFSTYRPGFEVRTYRLCRRVLMFHHFADELGFNDTLVRSTAFQYAESPIATVMSSVTQSGYTPQEDGSYLRKALPPLAFEYSQVVLDGEVQEIDAQSLENLPHGLDEAAYEWVDLDGEGLAGILTEQRDGWYYKRNWSPLALAGEDEVERVVAGFGPLEHVTEKPSLAGQRSGRRQLLDLAGDGQLDLVFFEGATPGFYERTQDRGWAAFRTFETLPNARWDDPNLRFVDLTGDGHADILITEADVFSWYLSLAETGFAAAEKVPVPLDEEDGPRLVFADGTQSVYLADLSGDGLSDLARIRNGEVCYWPNLGYGRFGNRVLMDNAPYFDTPDLFNQQRIRLADVDGSGITDIIYLGSAGAQLYFNESGNGWSDVHLVSTLPNIDNLASVTTLDLLGTGTTCLVWSSSLPGDEGRQMRYIDLMGGQKPHLLVATINNLGAETRVRYVTSTRFYLQDEREGKPWITKLPFPVHVVERIETYDWISRTYFVTRYAYHHGYFDGVEREFRGFGMVEQWDTEAFGTLSEGGDFPVSDNVDATSHVPPVLTRTWFHTGVFLDRERVSRLYAGEYYTEPGLDADERAALLLPDTVLPAALTQPNGTETTWTLTPDEGREACRALRGSILRQEIYALDGSGDAGHPYTVSERNYTLVLLQPQAPNRHAVFFAHPREEVIYHYERRRYDVGGQEVADPRISHAVTLAVDNYGNVQQTVVVGYGRRHPAADPLLTPADRQQQSRIYLTLTDNGYTGAVVEDDAYRAPLLAETRTFELHNVAPASAALFRFDELLGAVKKAGDGAHDLPFEDVDAVGLVDAHPHRRLVEHIRMHFRPDDLGLAAGVVEALLPLGTLESRALSGERYTLALTPGLLQAVYGDRVDNDVRNEGGYVDLDGDGQWWIPSGRVFYSPDSNDDAAAELEYAREHFFMALRYRDPFRATTHVTYDGHDLLVTETIDPLNNTVRAAHDYRVLQPALVTDANTNRSAVAFDALGMIVATAIMGKEGQNAGDSLDNLVADLDRATLEAHLANPLADPHAILAQASTRLVYNLEAYHDSAADPQPQPAVVYTLARETHDADLADGEETRLQHHFNYSDGFGRQIQQKILAEAGPVEEGGADVDPRWVGSGWTIFNNKGEPVRQYEPFFSSGHRFDFAMEMGVSPILFYDPLLRVVATLQPNHSWEKSIFDPWHQTTWDVNDTVLLDPVTDPDVGDFFRRLPDAAYRPTWHSQRAGGALGADEQAAAANAAAHAATPTLAHFDSLGRTFLVVTDNGDQPFLTRTEFDIEGKQLAVIDALDRTVIAHTIRDDANRRISGYDVAGNLIFQHSMDAGVRRVLSSVSRKPLRHWDDRGHTLRTVYDSLQRPTQIFVRDDGGERLVQRTVYGEPQGIAGNHRGRIFQQFDGAGVVTNEEYDFKGNLLRHTRLFTIAYDEVPNWSLNPPLAADVFATQSAYDALNRLVALTMPDNSVIRPRYNEASLLEAIEADVRGAGVVASFVDNIDYDAKAQRSRIAYGNGVETHYTYDDLTFRLTRLHSVRGGVALQDLHYVTDPVGNITAIGDDAQQDVYFDNAVVEARADYVYDALYRLVGATGREHTGQVGQPQPSWNDAFRLGLPHPHDGAALRRYSEQYTYDGAGNILKLAHVANNGNWTRTYDYDEASPLDPNVDNNRLTQMTVGGVNFPYTHDVHGNMTSMPHLAQMIWDYADRLRQLDLGGGGTAFYQYDASGRRVRKVIERQNGTRASERLYLEGFERYREFNGGGDNVVLERETLHVMDDVRRVALVDTRTQGDDGSAAQLIRYQFDNHLGSASLELDDAGQVISYEEYYPHGSTSYQAVRNLLQVPRKRYRYTRKERDEESGLYYHGARYYAPWLARWTSADPHGLIDGPNLYRSVACNPINIVDHTGTNGVRLGYTWEGRDISHERWQSTPDFEVAQQQLHGLQEALRGVGRVQADELGISDQAFINAEADALYLERVGESYYLRVDIERAAERRGARGLSWGFERLHDLATSSATTDVAFGREPLGYLGFTHAEQMSVQDASGSYHDIGPAPADRAYVGTYTESRFGGRRSELDIGFTLLHELSIHAWRDTTLLPSSDRRLTPHHRSGGHARFAPDIYPGQHDIAQTHSLPDIEAELLEYYFQRASGRDIQESVTRSTAEGGVPTMLESVQGLGGPLAPVLERFQASALVQTQQRHAEERRMQVRAFLETVRRTRGASAVRTGIRH